MELVPIVGLSFIYLTIGLIDQSSTNCLDEAAQEVVTMSYGKLRMKLELTLLYSMNRSDYDALYTTYLASRLLTES